MDPDVIFIIVLYLILFILTVVSIIGLSKKILKSNLSLITKLILIAILIILLCIGILKFDTVDTSSVVIRTIEVIIYSASILIALNWSIHLTKKYSFSGIKLATYLKVGILTLIIAILIPVAFYLLANHFDNLNLLGSGG